MQVLTDITVRVAHRTAREQGLPTVIENHAALDRIAGCLEPVAPTATEISGCQAICQLHSLRCTGSLQHSGSHNCPGGSGHTF